MRAIRTTRAVASPSIAWGADASTLFVAEPLIVGMDFVTATAPSGGLSKANVDDIATMENIQVEAGLIYGNTGNVFNPSTHAIIGSFTLNGSVITMVADSRLNRAYVLSDADVVPSRSYMDPAEIRFGEFQLRSAG